MIKYDNSKDAIINPSSFTIKDIPKKALIVYDDDYFDKIQKQFNLNKVIDANGNIKENFYTLNNEYLVMNPTEGAPVSAIMLEIAIASGVKSVVAFGTAGSLDGTVLPHNIIIPTSAIREEGISYHYILGSDEIEQDENSIRILKQQIENSGLDFIVGKTWTTDAFFRETLNKVRAMKANGCVCVDMECSALIAICRFRKVKFAQFLLSFDNLEANHNHRANYKDLLDDAVLKIAFSAVDKL